MKKECKTNHNYTVKTKHTHNSSTPGFVQTPANLINYNLQFINYKLLFDDNAAATQSAVCFIFFSFFLTQVLALPQLSYRFQCRFYILHSYECGFYRQMNIHESFYTL